MDWDKIRRNYLLVGNELFKAVFSEDSNQALKKSKLLLDLAGVKMSEEGHMWFNTKNLEDFHGVESGVLFCHLKI